MKLLRLPLLLLALVWTFASPSQVPMPPTNGITINTVTNRDPFKLTLGWLPSPTANLHSYVIYIATKSFATNGVLVSTTNAQPVPNLVYRIVVPRSEWVTNSLTAILARLPKNLFLPEVTHYLVVTADADGQTESEPSNEIQYTPPKPPGTFRVYSVLLQASDPAGPWKELKELPPQDFPAEGEPRFFAMRLRSELVP